MYSAGSVGASCTQGGVCAASPPSTFHRPGEMLERPIVGLLGSGGEAAAWKFPVPQVIADVITCREALLLEAPLPPRGSHWRWRWRPCR